MRGKNRFPIFLVLILTAFLVNCGGDSGSGGGGNNFGDPEVIMQLMVFENSTVVVTVRGGKPPYVPSTTCAQCRFIDKGNGNFDLLTGNHPARNQKISDPLGIFDISVRDSADKTSPPVRFEVYQKKPWVRLEGLDLPPGGLAQGKMVTAHLTCANPEGTAPEVFCTAGPSTDGGVFADGTSREGRPVPMGIHSIDVEFTIDKGGAKQTSYILIVEDGRGAEFFRDSIRRNLKWE